MAVEALLIYAALAILAIGTITDFRIREVPDWVNYSGIAIGLGLRAIMSASSLEWSFIVSGLIGFGIFYGFALMMFYLGQWGGGDSKMLMALGALLGFEFRPDSALVSFAVNMLLVGAAYGVLWSIYLAVRHRKKFIPVASRIVRTRRFIASKIVALAVAFALAIAALGVPDYLIKVGMLIIALGVVMTFYTWFFVKAIEKCCMIKPIPVEKLTEGDWIVKDIVISGKRICGPKDLGISKEQIKELLRLKSRGKINEILVKEGMPFVPSFFIAYIVTLIWGNLVLLFV